MVDTKKIIGTIINTLHVDIENAVTKFTKYMLGADSVKRMMTEFSKKYPAAAHRTVKDLPRVSGFLIGKFIKDEYFLTKEAADMTRASFNEIMKTVVEELKHAGDISSERFEQIVDEQIKKMDELPVVADLMGVMYHKPICFVLDNLDANKKKPLTWAKAIDGGYKACQHCFRYGDAAKSKKDPAQKMPLADVLAASEQDEREDIQRWLNSLPSDQRVEAMDVLLEIDTLNELRFFLSQPSDQRLSLLPLLKDKNARFKIREAAAFVASVVKAPVEKVAAIAGDGFDQLKKLDEEFKDSAEKMRKKRLKREKRWWLLRTFFP